MKEFVLIFRNSVTEGFKPSPEQMQQLMTDWMSWMGSVAAQDKLADKGNRLSMSEGKTVKPGDIVTDGPYTEVKEFINGYMIVKTDTIEEAVSIASECPILKIGGNVEVRKIVSPDDNS
ncbi:YciI family protein [Pararcticibacter amylolyticus]|uniref:Transcription initiation protein n=1 Tax=Pararcticibacter amylolyticus TaxID=2173175 RepID=A0A2U2PGP2_9SPHI|nr:YciI family protein [Pararcticibacter amylolyticus]PWG80577.1 transcription initiation protein [Pararcticibacter amylolyticus]